MLKNKKIFGIFFFATLLSLCFLFAIPKFSCAFGTVDVNKDAESNNLDVKTLSLGDSMGGLAKAILGAGLVFVRKVAAVCLTAAMSTLDLMLSDDMYSQVFFSPTSRAAINTGWGLVRDFVNMFYILILLFLAIATILRVNRFSDKKLMLSVVGSALLVNFSQAITFVFIDASNLAMNFFSSQISSTGASFTSLMAQQMNISDLWTGNSFFNTDGALITAFSEIIFTSILAITIFVLAIALIIRLIAFWVLIVLSPLAFFGLALPGTGLANLWRSWFSKLTSYAFFGPVLLFFLWLSLVLITALAQSKTASTIPNINDTPISAGDGLDGFVIKFFKNTIPFVAAIYMLFYGFSLSKDIAAKAGNAVGSVFNKGQGWMGKAGRYAAIAGTGAAGAAAYGLYKGGGAVAESKIKDVRESTKAYGGGLKKRLGFNDDEARKEKNEEREAKIAGGETLQKYNRKKVSEQLKDWKEKGDPTAEDQAKINTKGSQVEKMALAMHKAEKGKLSTAGDYEAAMSVMGKDSVSAGKLRGLAEKKNLHAVMDSDIGKANTIIPTADDATLDQAIDKNAVLKEMVRAEEERAGAPMNATARRAYLRGKSSSDVQKEAYENKLQGMSLKSIGEQDINFHKSAEFRDTMEDQINALPTSAAKDARREELRRFASRDSNMNAVKTKAWHDAGII